jgi:cyclopropane-fatty-acyl-phospholipid synthase
VDSTYPTTQPRLFDSLSRKLTFSLFNQIQQAGLLITDGDEQYFFGDEKAPLQAKVQVINTKFYRRLLTGGSIGVAESYVEGEWVSPDLVTLVRVFARNMPTLEKLEKRMGWITYPIHKLSHLRNSNTRNGSRTNIAAHYDLGNDLYQMILDSQMQYSAGIFYNRNDSLEQAQQQKLKMICDKLELKPDEHLIEIGTGWGGLACYAAKNYGCRVTTTTLSQQQFNYAKQMIEQQGLQDRITLLLKDYRDLEGQYDKLVSVEMIEAVGYRFLPVYFNKLEELLRPKGRLLIQAITIADKQFDQYRKGVDFIQRYIFPGGCLPSISEMCKQLQAHTSMSVTRMHDYGQDYADTLALWARNFKTHARKLKDSGYNDDFQRLWNFYFAYCEGGFREGSIGLVHFEATKQ